MLTDRSVLAALAASLALHGAALGLGGLAPAGVTTPPRVLEARLVPEEVLPEKPKVSPHQESLPRQPRPELARPELPRPDVRHSPAPALVPAVVSAPPRLVSEAPAERPAAPVISGASTASPVAAVQGGAPTPSTSSAGAAGSMGAVSAPTYSPPGFGAGYLHNPKPAYPMMARRRGLEGIVRLDVRVSVDGIPTAVRVRESSGHESLDEAATTAVWHWKFVPAKRGGEPIEDTVVVPVRFRLGDDAG
ncbi:MAG: energy transducer TonB [Proteobacteria bacterium]|nr:energy transducer TonB [Pseudomonadota bacterium]